MIIVIDGYNLLKHIFPSEKKASEQQRQFFIRQLAYYKHKKQHEIKELIVVFDAGPQRHATREIKSGIVIMFSGQKSSADLWIGDYVKRTKGQEIVVVTTDKALSSLCQINGATVIRSADFYELVYQCLLEDAAAENREPELLDLHKYDELNVAIDVLDERESTIDQESLDLLMEQASMSMPKDVNEKDLYEQKHTKGNPQTPSKKEKHQLAKLKKLK